MSALGLEVPLDLEDELLDLAEPLGGAAVSAGGFG